MEFVSNFDVPSSSRLKKDMAAVETGWPFSPAMFEGVLKNFTPDIPNSLSGRPRFVFLLCQYYFSVSAKILEMNLTFHITKFFMLK